MNNVLVVTSFMKTVNFLRVVEAVLVEASSSACSLKGLGITSLRTMFYKNRDESYYNENL